MAAQSCGAHNGRAAPMCWFVHSGARSCGVHRLLQTFGVRTTMIGTRCKWRDETLSNLIASINADRQHANLSSAIRLYVLDFYRDQYEAGDPSIRQTVNHST